MTLKPSLLDSLVRKASQWLKPAPAMTAVQFQQLLTPHQDPLYNFIVKSLYFSEDAEDVYQETVLRAFKYRHSFDLERRDSFKTWIFSIAANQIKHYFNCLLEEPARMQQEKLEQLPAESRFNPLQQRLAQAVFDITQELNPNQRRVFFLFYDEHFSLKEIVQITGLKEGNVKFILHQTREKIKNRLAQPEIR